MTKVSERLKSLAKYVFLEDKLMDVGCDHALLDIYLVENGMSKKIYVGDVNENALMNGKANISSHELTANIFPILSYGIEKIRDLDVDTLIISGMGAKTIIDILSSPNLNKIYKLILQANNNWGELRRFLSSRGFNIFFEEIVLDGKKTYINIVAGRDYPVTTYTESEYEFGPCLIKDANNIPYFESLRHSYEAIYDRSKSDEMKKKLDCLDEIISNLKNL